MERGEELQTHHITPWRAGAHLKTSSNPKIGYKPQPSIQVYGKEDWRGRTLEKVLLVQAPPTDMGLTPNVIKNSQVRLFHQKVGATAPQKLC